MKNKSLYIELYDFLEGFEQIEAHDIYEQIVNEWSEKQVEEFTVNVFQRIPNDFFERQSYFNFYANSTLAGAPYPCSALECRMKNVIDLLRFAALYADKILLPSPIDLSLIHIWTIWVRKRRTDSLRQRFLINICRTSRSAILR